MSGGKIVGQREVLRNHLDTFALSAMVFHAGY